MKLIVKISIAAVLASAVDAFSTVCLSRVSPVCNEYVMHVSKDSSSAEKNSPVHSKLHRVKQFGLQAWERMDTMKAAGLADGVVPLNAGFKTNVGLLVGAFLFKWYRARFVTKVRACFVNSRVLDSFRLVCLACFEDIAWIYFYQLLHINAMFSIMH